MSRRSEQRGVVLAVILVGYLLILIDVSILMAALPTIHHELGFSPTSLSWAQNAYTLTFGGLLLLGARVGDLAGRRRMFGVGITVFATASLAVGLAQSASWMIAARAVQGLGAAILAPSTLALLSASFPEGTQRTRAMAAYGALAGIGTAFGLSRRRADQRAVVALGILPQRARRPGGDPRRPRVLAETERHAARLDLAGVLSGTLGASALVFGMVHSADAGWAAGSTVATLAAGVALLALFVVDQARAEQPVMPLRLFADRGRAGA